MTAPSSSSQPVALITGGSRGIGRALVKRFIEGGYRVATCAQSVASLAESPAQVRLACDVSDVTQVKSFVSHTLSALGRIDVVINNAGVAATNPMEPEASDEIWHKVIGVNLNGSYYVAKATMPFLPNRTGRLLFIGSVLSHKGVPDNSAYVAAKHGVLGLTRSLAHFLAPRGITVNVICPGWVRTDMAFDRFAEVGLTEEKMSRGVPLGRFVEPEEVADLAWSLCQTSASAITGQSHIIDGGTLA